MIRSNLDALKWFDAQCRSLSHAREQLRAEAQSLIDLPPLRLDAFSIPVVPDMPSREVFRAQQVRLRLLEAVKQLAVSKDYEMEKISDGNNGEGVAMVSRKLIRLLPLLEGHGPDLLVEAAGLYLDTVQASMRPQLEQLPHFAALFHNDANHLAAFIASRVPNCSSCEHWTRMGTAMLEYHVQKQSEELREDLESPEDMERAVAKALMRIGQLARVWAAPLLSPPLLARTMRTFEAILLHALWRHLIALDYITEPVIARSKRLASSLLRAQETGDELAPVRRRIRAYVEAMDMSLMQLTNRIRRGAFKETLGPAECHRLIEALFEDSPSRAACLEELEEDIIRK